MKTNTGILAILVATLAHTSCFARSALPDLLPLAAGNTWTYVKTVPRDTWAVSIVILSTKKEGRYMSSFVFGDSGPVSRTETYKVDAHDKSGAWQISITSVPSSGKPRDGRYIGASKILWGRTSTGANTATHQVYETIVHDPEGFGPNKELLRLPAMDSHWLAPSWKTTVPRGRHTAALWSTSVGGCVVDYSTNRITTVKVAAGAFHNCVVTKEVRGVMGQDAPRTAYTTYSFFSPGVGLVKEVQKDEAGEVLYTMELKSYHLAK